MMKKTVLLLVVFFVTSLSGHAQVSEEEARRMYDEAEQQYEAQHFYECYQLCMSLKEKMGKDTPKTLYLMLKAIYNNLESNSEKSQNKINKAYENYNRFFEYSSVFLSLVDKKTYPEQKLSEIEKIHGYFQTGMQTYAHQKGRRPEDAIAFLNECARKFPNKKLSKIFTIISTNTVFTLSGPYLRIMEQRQKFINNPSLIIYDVRVTFLDFRKITGILSEKKGHYYLAYYNGAYQSCKDCTSWGFLGIEDKGIKQDPEVNSMHAARGIVVSNRSALKRFSKNGKKVESISRETDLLYTDTSIAPSIAFSEWKTIDEISGTHRWKAGDGYTNLFFLTTPTEDYDGTLFDQTSAEFRDGDYERRITEAFQFLVDYFPKLNVAAKKENKPPLNSKF